jgi:hypothetical protein
MKKKLLAAFFTISIISTALFAQDLKDTTGKNDNFMDRYYQVKASNEKYPDAFGPFAASEYSIDEYIKRYNGFKAGFEVVLGKHAGKFAGGVNDEKKFESKYYEIKKVYPDMKDAFADYAASRYNLQDFLTRYNEIKAAYPDMTNLYGAYAASDHKLEEFIKRYYRIRDSYPGMDDIYDDYAAGKRKLDKGDKGAN